MQMPLSESHAAVNPKNCLSDICLVRHDLAISNSLSTKYCLRLSCAPSQIGCCFCPLIFEINTVCSVLLNGTIESNDLNQSRFSEQKIVKAAFLKTTYLTKQKEKGEKTR